ncbi:MAG: zf-HC2 domain-containing protein [Bacillota bacterium]
MAETERQCPDEFTWEAWVDHELPADQQTALQEHRDQCPACRAKVAELQQFHLCAAGLAINPPCGFTDQVMQAVRSEEARITQSRRQMAISFVGVLLIAISCWWLTYWAIYHVLSSTALAQTSFGLSVVAAVVRGLRADAGQTFRAIIGIFLQTRWGMALEQWASTGMAMVAGTMFYVLLGRRATAGRD